MSSVEFLFIFKNLDIGFGVDLQRLESKYVPIQNYLEVAGVNKVKATTTRFSRAWAILGNIYMYCVIKKVSIVSTLNRV